MRFLPMLNPKIWLAAIWRAILHDFSLQTRAERLAAAEQRVLDGLRNETLNARYPDEDDAPFGPGVTVDDVIALLSARGERRRVEGAYVRTTGNGRRIFTVWWSDGKCDRRVRYQLRRVGHGFEIFVVSSSPQSPWEGN